MSDNNVNLAEQKYELDGGALCLDFVNTVGGSRHDVAREYLHQYSDLLIFCVQTGLISLEQGRELLAQAERQPEQAARAYQRAVDLREALFRIFESLIMRNTPQESDLEILNQNLVHTDFILTQKDGHYEWAWTPTQLSLDSLLGPLARSAADLLASGEHDLVRECGGENCSWLFVDRTRNHSRVWCDMKSCGNRAKVRRYRQKETSSE